MRQPGSDYNVSVYKTINEKVQETSDNKVGDKEVKADGSSDKKDSNGMQYFKDKYIIILVFFLQMTYICCYENIFTCD